VHEVIPHATVALSIAEPNGGDHAVLAVRTTVCAHGKPVAGLEIRGEAVAFAFSVMRKVHVVNEKVGQTPVLIVHTYRAASIF
jgi:hypothetical protein